MTTPVAVDTSYLGWPFFDDGHRAHATALAAWAARELTDAAHDEAHVDAACRALAPFGQLA